MTNYTRGRSREYATMRRLESVGWQTLRSAGSHGCWDVIGISEAGVLLVQVKLQSKPTPAEYAAMRAYRVPPNGTKVVHHYHNGCSTPTVEVI